MNLFHRTPVNLSQSNITSEFIVKENKHYSLEVCLHLLGIWIVKFSFISIRTFLYILRMWPQFPIVWLLFLFLTEKSNNNISIPPHIPSSLNCPVHTQEIFRSFLITHYRKNIGIFLLKYFKLYTNCEMFSWMKS